MGSRRFKNPTKVSGFKVFYFEAAQFKALYKEIFVRGAYLFHDDEQSPVILDCGSNIGMSILFFKKLFPRSRIVAFEPDPETYKLLHQNVHGNSLSDVQLVQCALSNIEGYVEFYRDRNVSGSLTMSMLKERMDGEKVMVPCRRLSSFIDQEVNLLKLDVEGAEERIIEDLVDTGKIHFIRQMHIEYHHHILPDSNCLSSFLSALERAGFGYQIHAPGRGWPSPRTFQDISIYCYRKS